MYNNLSPVSSLRAGLDAAGAMQLGGAYYPQQMAMPSYPMLPGQGYRMLAPGQPSRGPVPPYMYSQQYCPPGSMGLMMGGSYRELAVHRYMSSYSRYMGAPKDPTAVSASPTLPSLSPSPGLHYPPSSMNANGLSPSPAHHFSSTNILHQNGQSPSMMSAALHNHPMFSQTSKFTDRLCNLVNLPPRSSPNTTDANSFNRCTSYSAAENLANLIMTASSPTPLATPINISPLTTPSETAPASPQPISASVTTPINISPITILPEADPPSDQKPLYSFLDTEKRYMCHQCHYLTFREDRILQHVKTHAGTLTCSTCDKTFLKACDLERHMTEHESSSPGSTVPLDPACTDDMGESVDASPREDIMGSSGKSQSPVYSDRLEYSDCYPGGGSGSPLATGPVSRDVSIRGFHTSGLLNRLPPTDDVTAMRNSYIHHLLGHLSHSEPDPADHATPHNHHDKLLQAKLEKPCSDYSDAIILLDDSPIRTFPSRSPLPRPATGASPPASGPMVVPEPTLSSTLPDFRAMLAAGQPVESTIVQVTNSIHEDTTDAPEGVVHFENSLETSPELPRIESVCSMNVGGARSLPTENDKETTETTTIESASTKGPTPPSFSDSTLPISATDPKIVSINSVSPEDSSECSTSLQDFINLRRAVLGISPMDTPPDSPAPTDLSIDTSASTAQLSDQVTTPASLLPDQSESLQSDDQSFDNQNGLLSPINLPKKSPRGFVGRGKVTMYYCDVCSYSTKNPGHLEKHFLAHTSNFKSCQYCQKAFERPSDLVRHEERHEVRFSQTGNHNLGPTSPKLSEYLKKPKRKYMGRTSYSRFLQNRLSQYRATTMQVPYRGPAMGYGPEVGPSGMPTSPPSIPLPHSRLMPLPISMAHQPPTASTEMQIPASLTASESVDSQQLECGKCNQEFMNLEDLDAHVYKFHMNLPSRLDTYEKSTLISTSLIQCQLLGNNTVELKIEYPSAELLSSEGVPHVSAPRDLEHIKHKTISAQQAQMDVCIEIESPLESSDAESEELRTRAALESQRQALSESASRCSGPDYPLGLPGLPDDVCGDSEEDLPPVEVSEEGEEPEEEPAVSDDGPNPATPGLLDTAEPMQEDESDPTGSKDKVFKHPSVVTGSRENYRSPGKAYLGPKLRSKATEFYCARCNYGTNMPHKFAQHEKAHNGRWVCKYCQRACIKLSDLTRHWATHVDLYSSDGTFPCDSCSFRTQSRDIMEVHMKRHYVISRSTRNKLPSPAESSSDPLPPHKPQLASDKNDQFESSSDPLPPHKPQLASDKNDQFEFLEDTCVYCDECGAGFSTSLQLKRHRRIKHVKRKKKSPGLAYPCPQCGRNLPSQFLLDRHLAAHQKHPNGMGGKTCQFCHKMFRSKAYCKQHERIHTGETPFVCHCGAKFALRQTLHVHKKLCTLPPMLTNLTETNAELPLAPIPSDTGMHGHQQGADTPAETSVGSEEKRTSPPASGAGLDRSVLVAERSRMLVTGEPATRGPFDTDGLDSEATSDMDTEQSDETLTSEQTETCPAADGGPYVPPTVHQLSVPNTSHDQTSESRCDIGNQSESEDSGQPDDCVSDTSSLHNTGMDVQGVTMNTVLRGACSQIMEVSTGIAQV